MTQVVDYAWAQPNAVSLVQAGISGIVRYLSLDSSKDLSRAEITASRAAGLDITVVWETTATRALQGTLAGVVDAQLANAKADALGYPRSCAIYYTCDTDATAAQVRLYYLGAASVGLRSVGAYGGIRVVDPLMAEGTVPYGWQTTAWSGGQVSALAQLFQRYPPQSIAGAQVDVNTVMHPNYGQWMAHLPPAPPPAPDPHPTSPCVGFYATASGNGYWQVGADGGVFAYGDATFHGSLGATVLTKPIVGFAATKDQAGYWLVGADGGVFNFGSARFYGSLGHTVLTAPIVSLFPTPTNNGYWLVGADYGVFAYGDAVYLGHP